MPVGMKPVSVNEYGSIVYTPPLHHLGDVERLPSGEHADVLRHARPAAEREVADAPCWLTMSILTRLPWNSQVKMA